MSQLPIVTLSQKRHRKENQILMDFEFNRLLINAVKQIHGARWSATHRKWYVRNNPKNLKSIFNVFKGLARVNSMALSKKVSQTKQYETNVIRGLTAYKKYGLNGINGVSIINKKN